MRVLQITSARYLGGGERHVADLASGLQRKGHEIFVALAPGAALLDELSFLPAEQIVELPFRGSLDYPTTSAIGQFAKAEKIDLIHAHVARDYPITAAAALLSKLPFVITRHVLFPMSRIHRFVLRNVSYVIAPSNAVARSLHEQQIFPAERIVTIRHGLDPSRYGIREPVERNGFVVGSIGNLDPVKGFDILIRAVPAVLQEFPQTRLVIAGIDRSADGRHERDLRRLIADLALEDRVALTGWSDDIPQTLAGFDLFVSSSRSESFGYAIAEAMLSGVPVIATETEGAREIISDPSIGKLVPVESTNALSEAIVELRRNSAKLASFAHEGRSHVRSEFDMARMIDETEAVYERAVDAG